MAAASLRSIEWEKSMAIWRRIRPVVIDPLYHYQTRCLSYLAGAPLLNRACGRRRSSVVEKPLCLSPALESSFISVRSFAAPVQAKPKPKFSMNSSAGPRLNDTITAPFVRVVSDEGHCIVSRLEALDRAKKLNLDLVEVQRHANPPVCKIMDFYKEKFRQEVKVKERVKSKVALRNGENKEIRFTPKTDLKDLKMKADTITRLMERGYRVKCTAMPAGRENEGLPDILSKVLALIEDVSIVESGPHAEASKAYVIVRHVKFAAKKSGKKVSEVLEAASKGVPSTKQSGQDDTSSQDEEEWETVDDSSAIEVEDFNDQIEAKAQSFSSVPHTSESSPSRNFSKELGLSGFKEKDFNRMTDPNSIRNSKLAGFNQNTNTPRPADRSTEPSVVETNRYARQTDPNGRFNQVKPTPRRASTENPVFNQGRQQPPRNTSEGQVQFDPRQRQPSPRNPQVQSDPRQRQSNPTDPVIPSPRYGVFMSSKTASSSDATVSEPNNSSKPSYGIFSGQKVSANQGIQNQGKLGETNSSPRSYGIFSAGTNIASAEKKNPADATADKPGNFNAGRTSFGIFSEPNRAASSDQRNTKDANNPNPSPPRFGIFSSSSDQRN
ncbi:translation initiation factor IF3-1, mitochondrial [Dioscorea cayenensis subsp. rotundata]|uniref:Translation initiation factor IF3-1, mitochondrial n=1 Tax=Dioscorea cayennensis subsp. rotundata TaxID=55577 RepID=A0AB40B6Q1_DIOCR|nr:translation initiation factor IF3-1, mitochondrial [Dioscorea cayenensis subsp. rotundata]